MISSHSRSTALLGSSPVMVQLRADLERAARTDAKVLLLGETGCGKEVAARVIHERSARRSRPFMAVNCSGIPETLLESELFGHMRGSFTDAYRDKPGVVRQAEHGTLFLDELGEMSLRMQAVLLRFAESGEIQPVGATTPARRANVRLIAATNQDLRRMVNAGGFREDLLYRLNVIEIRIPPLRERGNDIAVLFDYYLNIASQTYAMPRPELTAAARDMLLAYAWPGNVRELKNVTERLVIRELEHAVHPSDLPPEIRGAVRGRVADPPQGRGPVAPVSDDTQPSPVVKRLWDRLLAGDDFWTVVQQPFKSRAITRQDLTQLIDLGLTHTHGSYRALVKTFNMPPEDYKRFLAFLHQQHCNLAVRHYRYARPASVAARTA